MTKFNISLKRHVKEGIALPLNNITITPPPETFYVLSAAHGLVLGWL